MTDPICSESTFRAGTYSLDGSSDPEEPEATSPAPAVGNRRLPSSPPSFPTSSGAASLVDSAKRYQPRAGSGAGGAGGASNTGGGGSRGVSNGDADPVSVAPMTVERWATVNGCTCAPDIFIDACNQHDLDYQTCGMSKLDADHAFLARLEEACPPGSACHPLALVYYGAVCAGARGAYDEAQKSCVPETHQSQIEPREVGSVCGF